MVIPTEGKPVLWCMKAAAKEPTGCGSSPAVYGGGAEGAYHRAGLVCILPTTPGDGTAIRPSQQGGLPSPCKAITRPVQ